MDRACVKGRSSSNYPTRRLSESVGSFRKRLMFTNFKYPSPRPPFALAPETLRSSSTQNAMSLPKFPATKMLKNPASKSVRGTLGDVVDPAGVEILALAGVYWKNWLYRSRMGGS